MDLVAVFELPAKSLDEKLDQLDAALIAHPNRLANMLRVDEFPPGLYVRTVVLEAGSVITTRIHKVDHPYFLSSGLIEVIANDGTIQRVRGPARGTTKKGTRRAIRTIETCVWTTVHPNPDNITDIEKLEAMFTEDYPHGHLLGAGPVVVGNLSEDWRHEQVAKKISQTCPSGSLVQ